MKKISLVFILFCAFTLTTKAQIKILFDATKAETAGNADWVIDADLFNSGFNSGPATIGGGNEANPQKLPTPLQTTITSSTLENYWKGGISAWGIDCVKKGYLVETLPYNGAITYGNSRNTQDLSNYKIFVVVEPNIVFSASEKTAIINFVHNGGSLFIVSDHTVSDRNNDGWDSPAIWNDLFTNNGIATNPFGITFDLTNVSGNSTNTTTNANDSLIHGSFGNVTQALWSNGATITINLSANSTVKAAMYKSGVSNTGNTNIYVAYAHYGLGKVIAFGDSSPFDDGTGDTNDQLYNGYYTDAAGNHQKLIMNATIWLATQNTLPVTLSSFDCILKKVNSFINWNTSSEINTSYFNIQESLDGKIFMTVTSIQANGKGANYSFNYNIENYVSKYSHLFYRLEIVDKDGSKTYSDVKTLAINQTKFNASIYPNPASNFIVFQTENISSYSIVNNIGVIVKSNLIHKSFTNISIDELNKGCYSILFKTNTNNIFCKKLVKQ